MTQELKLTFQRKCHICSIMSDQEKTQESNSETAENEVHKISRQQLLKAGWVVPAVMAINLPTAVQAQTAIPFGSLAPGSVTSTPTGTPTVAPTVAPGAPTVAPGAVTLPPTLFTLPPTLPPVTFAPVTFAPVT